MTESIRADPGLCTKTAWIQIGYGLWGSMTMLGIGLAFGFPAVTIPQLKDVQSTIQLTTSDESWIASVLNLVAPLGCVSCGYLMDKFGRKIILIFCELPLCVGWLYTGFATTAKDIIIGRIITGVGIGMAMGAPRIYITEISLPNMRGTIGAFPNLAMSMGLTMLALFGAFWQWKTICFVCGAYSFLLLVVNFLLPETPYFLLLKGTQENAKNSLKKFRSASYRIDREINEMMEYKTVNDIRRLTFKEEVCLLCTKAACKPFWIIVIYVLLSQVTGVTIVFMWTIELIQASRSSVDANFGNVLLGITRFFTGIISSLLLYKIGRRPQALVSSVGVGVAFISLGSIIHAKAAPSVFPVICYMLVVMFATLGYYTIPLLIMYELYPLQIRGFLGGITVSLLNFFIFGANKLYPFLRNLIGHENVVLCFGILSILGSFFLYFFLPETKDLTLQEIEEYFNDRRATLVSQRSVIAAQLHGMVQNSRSHKSLSNLRHSKFSLKHSKTELDKDIIKLGKQKKHSSAKQEPDKNENKKQAPSSPDKNENQTQAAPSSPDKNENNKQAPPSPDKNENNKQAPSSPNKNENNKQPPSSPNNK